jgi:transcriptional regulator with XRE-family HTH domain
LKNIEMKIMADPNLQCGVRASFAAAFRNWRVQNNVPLKMIASDLGLAVSTINSWELGERFPSGCNFEALVSYTGLPPCKLFCVMASRCVPVECLLAMSQKTSRSNASRLSSPCAVDTLYV